MKRNWFNEWLDELKTELKDGVFGIKNEEYKDPLWYFIN